MPQCGLALSCRYFWLPCPHIARLRRLHSLLMLRKVLLEIVSKTHVCWPNCIAAAINWLLGYSSFKAMLDACHFMLATLVVWECPPTNVFFMAPWSLITKQKFKCYLAQGITEGKTLSSKHCSPVSTQVSWLVASHRITIVCGIQSSGMASSAGMECKYCMWSWNWSTKLPCDAAMQFDQRSCGSRTGNGTIICKAVTLPDFLFFSRWDGGFMEMKLCEMVLWRTVLIWVDCASNL